MDSHRPSTLSAGLPLVAAAIVILLAAAVLWDGSRTSFRGRDAVHSAHAWDARHLSAEEIRGLASRIACGPTSPADASKSFRDRVGRLSIRQAAALGTILMDQYKIDPRPWLGLPHARERAAVARLQELLRRFDTSEQEYRSFETTVRGPRRLRQLCGKEMLTEVTGVGFWKFYDGPIPAPTSFCDKDVDVVMHLPGLEWVTAQWSKLTDAGVARLAKLDYLRELRIAGADVSEVSLQELGQNHHLRVIDISEAKRVDDAGVEALGRCRELEELNLAGTGITSACLPVISRFRELRILSLSDTRVGAGLSQLSVLRKLCRLELKDLGRVEAPLPSEDITSFTNLKQTEVLLLEGAAIERIELGRLPKLRALTLGHATLKDLMLFDLPKIETLRIKSPYGKAPLTLGRLQIRNLKAVISIHVEGLTPDAADGLAGGLPTLPSLKRLYLDLSVTDALAGAIGDSKQLELLQAPNASITDAQLANVARAPQLASVSVGGKALSRQGLVKLRNARNLHFLELNDVVLDDADFLRELSVTSLGLKGCRIGRVSLDESVPLSVLNMWQSSIGDLAAVGSEHFRYLSCGCGGIERLVVDSCPHFYYLLVGGATLEHARLRNLPALESMTLQEGTSLGDLRLEKLPSLKAVTFWAAHVKKQNIEALCGLPALKRLDISATPLGNDAAAVVARLKTLEKLGASSGFGMEGLQEIARLPLLRELHLYHRPGSDWTPEEARRVFSHIPEVTVFTGS